jgi:MFS superfamily sulfate permease-like transporter
VLVEAVLSVVARAEPAPTRLVLSLEASEEIDDDACDALLEIYFRLRANGIRLYLGALPRAVFERLRRNGVVDRLGTDAVWPSLQTALLAAYEDLAGPTVVTRAVVARLHRRVVPLALSGRPADVRWG